MDGPRSVVIVVSVVVVVMVLIVVVVAVLVLLLLIIAVPLSSSGIANLRTCMLKRLLQASFSNIEVLVAVTIKRICLRVCCVTFTYRTGGTRMTIILRLFGFSSIEVLVAVAIKRI